MSYSISPAALAYLKLGAEQVSESDAGISYLPADLDVTAYDDALEAAEAEYLEAARQAHLAALSAACAAAIVGGFTSEALGSAHVYPSDIKDQINLMGSVTDSLLPGLPEDWATPFWCCDDNGVWAFRPHSAVAIQEAGRDGKAHVVACQATLEALTTVVLAAETEADIAAVAWPSV